MSVTFRFRSNQSSARFRCKLDDRSYVPCSSPKSYTVRRGTHTFRVRAVRGSTVDRTPATYTFHVRRRS